MLIKPKRIKDEVIISRSEVIHNNFFNELSKRKISFTKYANDNNLDKTNISKWKHMITCMNSDQIYQLANI